MKIYLVGGAVRDRLLKLPSHEQDWVVVGATVQELLKQGFQQVGASFPVFLHPQTHEEYALARQEKKTSAGHQGFSCQFSPDVSLEQDLLRRDLTINAMAMDEHGQIIDPYHGIDDLRDRKLRHVSKAFTEDPLRVLRVARFHAKLYDLGFSIAPETLALMQDMVNQKELLSLSPERIWKEWLKAFQTPHPDVFLTTLQKCGALQQLLPQLQLTTLQIPWQHLTDPHLRMILVWTHCLVSSSLAQKIQTFKELRKKLNIPTRLTQMTIKYFKLLEYLTPEFMQANTILQLLEQLDSYRCPTDFEQCLQCAVIDQQLTQKQQNILVKLCHACQHLPLPPNLQHHANVPAIKNYLQQTRLHIIEQELSHFA